MYCWKSWVGFGFFFSQDKCIDVTLTQISVDIVKCERSGDLLSWGFSIVSRGVSTNTYKWCNFNGFSALLENSLRAKMSLPNNMNAGFIQSNLSSCFIFNYSIHCAHQWLPLHPQYTTKCVLWPGPLGSECSGMRCSVWHRCIHAPVPAEWSGMDRAALGSSVMLRAKPGTKQGWQCMFFPTQCPGTLPLLMNTLSSFCSELILLWILCTFQFFCCSCASSSVDFYSQDLCFFTFCYSLNPHQCSSRVPLSQSIFFSLFMFHLVGSVSGCWRWEAPLLHETCISSSVQSRKASGPAKALWPTSLMPVWG